jgi:hypothetical protein
MRVETLVTWPVLVASMALCATTAARSAAPSWHLALGPEESVDIGKIHNAPNGHISFQKGPTALTLWVDGRTGNFEGARGKENTTQGTFVLHPATWNIPDLEGATPVNVFKGTHNGAACDAADGWDRDYAAINSIIPGVRPGERIAFVDGEFHPLAQGNPLMASIGVATSTDGLAWHVEGAIIRGMDVARYGCSGVASRMHRPLDNEGAAGPSAVVRQDGTTRYIYLYYEDRVRLAQGGHPSSDVYVARASHESDGAPGAWQVWTGKSWSQAGGDALAKPIVTAPPEAGEAAHPQVSYNLSLNRWLMIFHTRRDLYVTSSEDGTSWESPRAVAASMGGARSPSFPTLVSPGQLDQQTTGASGWLFYSREINNSSPTGRNAYQGYRRSFTIASGSGGAGEDETPGGRGRGRGRGRE